ncbi:hypothetical protein IFR05_014890, partial [Cadophora sp. M221]
MLTLKELDDLHDHFKLCKSDNGTIKSQATWSALKVTYGRISSSITRWKHTLARATLDCTR